MQSTVLFLDTTQHYLYAISRMNGDNPARPSYLQDEAGSCISAGSCSSTAWCAPDLRSPLLLITGDLANEFNPGPEARAHWRRRERLLLLYCRRMTGPANPISPQCALFNLLSIRPCRMLLPCALASENLRPRGEGSQAEQLQASLTRAAPREIQRAS